MTMTRTTKRAATYVPPEGNPKTCKWALVGEQPGKTEILRGKPFIGPAGNELNNALTGAGLNRQQGYLTYVVKDLDKPLEHYFRAKPRGEMIQTEAGHAYFDALIDEVRALNCNVIVACGNVALWALTQHSGVTKWRGSVLRCIFDDSKMVVPCIHPATIIPPKRVFLNKHLLLFDLRRVRRIVNGEYTPLERNIKINPTFAEAEAYLLWLEEQCLAGHPILAYDIEIYNMQVSCISLAHDLRNAMSIPFINSRGDHFTPEQEVRIWELIARLLENPKIPKIGQNLVFDAHFLLRRYGIRAKNLNDTMVAQQILMPDFPKGLDFITSIWTDHPYYKDEGKKWFRMGGAWEQLWQYNATDSIICAEAFPKQMEQLINQKNVPTYERQRQVIEPVIYMMERGIACDVEGMKHEQTRMLAEAEELQNELNRVAGCSLNPNSPKQLKQFFYVEKGFKPYLKKGSGNITVDAMALKRLARKGSREAQIILQIRKLIKLSSTYLNIEKVDSDGRMRCSYNPVGTRYSRMSSSETIFGTGMNLQNWPHRMLSYLKPDEGYVYYSFDLSQAENRIVAYVGNIPQMIHAFETGQDVHRLTAGLIFNKPAEEVSDVEGSSPFGDGKSERDWGKRANHGLNYDLGYRSFALYYEIAEPEAKFIVESYHRAYPGVRQNYHAYVRSQLRESRTVTNLMGRRTLFLGPFEDETFKEAYSCIPQGTTGDIVNERGLNFIYYNQHQFGPLELLVQVHDSIGFQIPLSTSWHEHARMLDAIKRSLETPLKTHWGREFVIPVDLTLGLTLNKSDGRDLKAKQWPSDLNRLAAKLEETYWELCNGSKA